jgi:hypothetical protein
MNSNKQSTNAFTVIGLILYFTVIVVLLAIYLTPLGQVVWSYLDDLGLSEIKGHISNFILSIILLFALGSVALLYNASWKRVLVGAAFLLVANFITELFITQSNTKDVVDALYGTIGVVIALSLLIIMDRYGISRNDSKYSDKE